MMWKRGRAVLAGLAVCGGPAAGRGQMHHVDAPERVTRAVGVYEWTGDLSKPTSARFVPVSLFIDGRYEDAGLYLARPVPFALLSGDLYTVERSGQPEGVLDLQTAERVVTGNALADDSPAGFWYGFGKFTAEAAPKAGPPLRKSAHLGVVQGVSEAGKPAPSPSASAQTADAEDGRPKMTRRGATGDSGGGTASSSGQDTSGTTGSSGSSRPDDTDRPTLARRDPAQDAARRKAAVGGKTNQASVTAVGPTPGDDPDRPTLSHKSADAGTTKALTGMPADLHQAVAVSDPVLRDPHPFARAWEDPAERASTLAALAALAKPRVAAYLAENKLVAAAGGTDASGGSSSQSTEGVAANTENGAGAAPTLQRGKPREYGGAASEQGSGAAHQQVSKPASQRVGGPAGKAKAGRGAKPAAVSPLTLRDEQISGYTLSYGGLPTFVYTASVPAATAAGSTLTGAAAHPTAFVTVVAQRLPSGELQVALGAVTDSEHLDRGARLHLIDAVDPDASHRASLLFELRGSASRQFALYRLVTAKAENTFTSASIE